MNKKYAIFDMDGTLVDSMVYWKRLAEEFLHQKGVQAVPADVLEQIRPMTMVESAKLFKTVFHLEGTPENIANEMNALMDRHYQKDIPLKCGVREYLEELHLDGVKMCVASATAEPLMEACLSRLGVAQYFEFLLSCETVGVGKNKPNVYLAAAKRLMAEPEEIAVYEDALYAAKTAKSAGFYVVGVFDESAAEHFEELKCVSNEVVGTWQGGGDQ